MEFFILVIIIGLFTEILIAMERSIHLNGTEQNGSLEISLPIMDPMILPLLVLGIF